MSVFREAPRVHDCPRCGENLARVSGGVEACSRCEGVWLPKLTIETAFGTPYWPPGPGQWWRRQLACPACSLVGGANIMTPIQVDNFLVDRCYEHGVWLDAGELGRLLDAPHAIELEAFYERLRPDAELPPGLAEFRKLREAEREKRMRETELERKNREAEAARIRAEREAALAAERARRAEEEARQRALDLRDQRAAIQTEYDETRKLVGARERELVTIRERVENRERELTAMKEQAKSRELALDEARVRLVELEGKLDEIDRQLQ